VRTSEALGAQFNEFNLAAKVWTISAEQPRRSIECRWRHAPSLSSRNCLQPR